jgi:hypothetical protein
MGLKTYIVKIKEVGEGIRNKEDGDKNRRYVKCEGCR